MDPLTITTLLSQFSNIVPSLFQTGVGVSQLLAAKKYGKEKRPEFEIPPALLEAVERMKDVASQRELPGAGRIYERLEKTQADALATLKESASSPGELLSGLQKVTDVTAEKKKDVGVAGEQAYNQNQFQLAKVLEGLSEMQEKQFMYNKYMPYLQAMDAAKRLSSSGLSNVYSGMGNITGVGQNTLQTLGSNKDFLTMFSNGLKESGGDYDSKKIFDFEEPSNPMFQDLLG